MVLATQYIIQKKDNPTEAPFSFLLNKTIDTTVVTSDSGCVLSCSEKPSCQSVLLMGSHCIMFGVPQCPEGKTETTLQTTELTTTMAETTQEATTTEAVQTTQVKRILQKIALNISQYH